MNKVKPPGLCLADVVMPLVRIMSDADLSWAEREKVSEAISRAHHQWKSLEAERSLNAQVAASGCQNAALQQGYQGPKPSY